MAVLLEKTVNVSAVNLEEDDFAGRVAAALQLHAVLPGSFEIEFTESALITKRVRVLRTLTQIRESGVVCAIDDFGTGYSSFSYLQDIPADTIKIDQSFIRSLKPKSRSGALVRNIINMARELDYRVVAEGVETQEVYDFLAAAGCDDAQGYFISRPVAPDDLLHWLHHHEAGKSDAA